MFETDLSGFAELITDLDTGLTGALPELARDLAEDAESYAFERIQQVIYDTPERFYNGEVYVRTGLLKASLNASAEADGDGLDVSLSTGAGAGNRHYGLENELGRGGSRVSLERVLRDARASADPLNLPTFERKDELEARPTVLPVIAALEDELPERVLKIIDDLV